MAKDLPSSEFYWDNIIIEVCDNLSAPMIIFHTISLNYV